MANSIYIVVADAGSRSNEDMDSWIVCAYYYESLAKAHAALAQRRWWRLWRASRLWRDLRYDERPGLDTKYINDFGDAKDGTNPYDPGMRWNDSIRYDVVCVSLRGPRDGHRPDVPALYC